MSERTPLEEAKQRFAELLAGGEADLIEAIGLALDEIIDEMGEVKKAPKMVFGGAEQHGAPEGWPEIHVGEPVVFKDHWCRVVRFTKQGVELAMGEPTAALLKRVGARRTKKERARARRNSRGRPRGPAQAPRMMDVVREAKRAAADTERAKAAAE